MSDTFLNAQKIRASIANGDYNAYEAARSGFFTLEVKGINDIVRASYAQDPNTAEEGNITHRTSKQSEEVLKLNVVNAPVPHFSLQKLSYRRGNDVVNFAGVPDFSDGEITVDDLVGLDTKSILMAWQGLAYNVHTGKGGRMRDYKKTCWLYEYTQDFSLIRKWKLEGCWIQNITEDAFNKEQDGKRQIRATIVYDRAMMDISDSEEQRQ